MPVLAKLNGIVIRMLIDRTFGTHFHAFYGESELVIGLNPTRVIQGEAPPWVRQCALDWVGRHQLQLGAGRAITPKVAQTCVETPAMAGASAAC